MSIIYDALKKVEQSRKLNPEIKIDKPVRSKPRIYFVYALVVVFGFFIANLFWGFLTPKPKEMDIYNYNPPHPSITQSEPAIAQSEPARPTFILNGIFFSAGEGYALINNQIAKVGDIIDGAKVLRISVDEVDLQSNEGSVIKLSCSK